MTSSDLMIRINEFGDYTVRLAVPDDVAARAMDRIFASGRWFDGEPGLWVYDGNRNIGVNADEDGGGITVSGTITVEGDDACDGTFVPTELGLADRLHVAATIRELIA
jgi:hypothetical protein